MPRGPLGYGASEIADSLSFGPDGGYNCQFLLARRTFEMMDVGALGTLKLRLRADDGAVVSINGNEVPRDNLRPGAALEHHTRRIVVGVFESVFKNDAVPLEVLLPGTNVIAVEGHQTSNSCSDLILELALEARRKTIESPRGRAESRGGRRGQGKSSGGARVGLALRVQRQVPPTVTRNFTPLPGARRWRPFTLSSTDSRIRTRRAHPCSHSSLSSAFSPPSSS